MGGARRGNHGGRAQADELTARQGMFALVAHGRSGVLDMVVLGKRANV